MKKENNDIPKIYLNQKLISNNPISQSISQPTPKFKPLSFKSLKVYDNEDEINSQNIKDKNTINNTEKTNNNTLINSNSDKDLKENLKIPDNINKILDNNEINDSSFDSYPDDEIPTEQFTKSLNHSHDNNNNNQNNNFNNPTIEKIETIEKIKKVEENEKNKKKEEVKKNDSIDEIENKENKENKERK